MVLVIGINFPDALLSSIKLLPVLIASLNLILIILFVPTFNSLLAGSTEITLGGLLSVVKLELKDDKPEPERSIKLPV